MPNAMIKSALISILWIGAVSGQNLADIDVRLNTHDYATIIPLSINLDLITYLSDDSLTLFKIIEDNRLPVAFQVKNGQNRSLHWLIQPDSARHYTFEIWKSPSAKTNPDVKFKKENGRLIIHTDNKNLLAYQYDIMYPPAGVDSVFQRNAFIHPLWSPMGQILTRVQPPDHYHHYGIWNPWTHVLFEGDTLDFWNLGKKQGTVRFDKFLSMEEGPVFAEFRAIHEHVVFKKNGAEKVAMNELQSLRVYNPQNRYYMVDWTINLNCAADSSVKLLEYRYGGFGWRATEQWNKENSMMLSSEGKTRLDIDNTRASWFLVQGEVDSVYAGVLMMSHAANFNYPQPMRMWGITQEDRGDVYASFSPTRDRDWLLEPGKIYQLKYRFVIYNDSMEAPQAESFWQDYQQPPVLTIKKKML